MMLASFEIDGIDLNRRRLYMEPANNVTSEKLFETSRNFHYLDILRLIFGISMPVSILTFYLICFQTTKSMGLYKNYLLSMTFWNTTLCFIASFLLQYEMLETATMIIVIRGPIKYLGEFAAHICTICAVACTNNLGMSIALCSIFKYLHLSGRVASNSWKPKQLLAISAVVHIIATLITVTPTALSYMPPEYTRNNPKYMYYNLLQLLPNETILVYDPSINVMVTYYAIIRLAYGFLTYGTIFVCLGLTIWVLKIRKSAFRKKTYRMQEMLIRTLIIHTLIPVVGLLIPFFVIPFLFNCYVAKLQILNVLSICLSTVFNNISTIYTIKPYRDAIIRFFSTKSWHDKVKRNSKLFRSMEVTTDCESTLYIEAKEKGSDKSSKSDQAESHAF